MENSFLKQAADFLKKKKRARRWLVLFVCLAVVLTTGTFAALKLNGQAMTRKSLACSYEVHQHTEDCYEMIDGVKTLTCGQADYVVHEHNADCYAQDGSLICQLPEKKEHKHTDACYTTGEPTLTCGQEESEGHTHTDECKDENGNLICGQEESEGHTHTAECYAPAEPTLTCGKEESEGHTHDDSCYTEEKVLTCGELELHTHTAECYDKPDGIKDQDGDGKPDGKLVCNIPELKEHTHTEECFQTVEPAPQSDEPSDGEQEDTDSPLSTIAVEDNTDLFDFVDKVEITHTDGTPIEGNKLYVGEDYKIHIVFSEKGAQGIQFGTDGTLTYQIPKSFKVDPQTDRTLTAMIDGEEVEIGTYSIDENGKLTITLSDKGKAAVANSQNISLVFDMDATAQANKDGKDTDVNFGSEGGEFHFEVVDQPRVDVEKTGVYEERTDKKGGTLHYTVQTTVEHGELHDTVVSDELTPPQTKALEINEIGNVTVKVKKAGSEDVVELSPDNYELEKVVPDASNPYKKSFKVKLKEGEEYKYAPLVEGDELYVTYDYDVQYVEGSTDMFWGSVMNEVTVTGSMPVENPDEPGSYTDVPVEEKRGSDVEIYATPPGHGVVCKAEEYREADRTLHYTCYTIVPAGTWAPLYIQDDMLVEYEGQRWYLPEFKEGGRVKNLKVSAVDVKDWFTEWNDSTSGSDKITDMETLRANAKELTGYYISDRAGYDSGSLDNYVYRYSGKLLNVIFGYDPDDQEGEWGHWNYETDRLIITEYDLDMSGSDPITLEGLDAPDKTLTLSPEQVLLAGIKNNVNLRFNGYYPGYSVFFNNGEKMNKTGKLDKETNTIEYTVTLNTTDSTVNKYFRDVFTDVYAQAKEYGWGSTWYSNIMQTMFYDELPDGWEYVPGTLKATARGKYNNEQYFPFNAERFKYSESQEKGIISAPLVYFYNEEGTGNGNKNHELYNTFNDELIELRFTYTLKATDEWIAEHAATGVDIPVKNHAEIIDKNMMHWEAYEEVPYFPARLTKKAEQVEGSNLLRFTIDVNPNNIDFDAEKDYLFVTDESENLQISTETIKVLDAEGKALTKKEGAAANNPVGGKRVGHDPDG